MEKLKRECQSQRHTRAIVSRGLQAGVQHALGKQGDARPMFVNAAFDDELGEVAEQS
jgi:hypothetical protein